ncbi:transport protein%2C potassium [Neisseria meningitidis]|nr:transport protein%2C potassium [Neisseria meningitidis]
MHKILPIAHVLSRLGMLFSFILLIPAALSYAFSDGAYTAFATTATVTLSGSYIVRLATLRFRRELRPRDGFTLVLMLWLAFAAMAAMPMYLYFPNMGFTDAFFESMSGLTTTGATVIPHVDGLAPSVNFWRHMLNWLGGMGIIVLAVAILPMLGVGGTQLFKAEIPGIDKESKMSPRISQVAKKLWFGYTLITILAAACLHFAGMSWFDAVCHAMATLSLGGFSTHDASIAYYNSPLIEAVIIVFTIVGGINLPAISPPSTAAASKPIGKTKNAGRCCCCSPAASLPPPCTCGTPAITPVLPNPCATPPSTSSPSDWQTGWPTPTSHNGRS